MLILKEKTTRRRGQNHLRRVVFKISYRPSLKKLLLYFLFSISLISLRILLQPLPSVEPLLGGIVFMSYFFGLKESLFFSFYAYGVSNYFMLGGNGVWTIFQTTSAVISSLFSYFFYFTFRSSFKMYVFVSFLCALMYEIIINLSMSLLSLQNPFTYFIYSFPFSVTHIFSTMFFAILFWSIFKK